MADEELSILDSTKKALGLAADYTPFDPEIIMHINSVLADLVQLGVGPAEGFSITDNTALWATYLGDGLLLNNVKSYMFLRVKVLFDGPDARYVIAAITEQIKQFEWRILATTESTGYVNPLPPNVPPDQFQGTVSN